MAWLDVADHVPMIYYGVMVSEVGDFQSSRFIRILFIFYMENK
ncbi:MAG: hypothetical protein ABII01_01805 [Candidatus Woesearchaeota archaeon]